MTKKGVLAVGQDASIFVGFCFVTLPLCPVHGHQGVVQAVQAEGLPNRVGWEHTTSERCIKGINRSTPYRGQLGQFGFDSREHITSRAAKDADTDEGYHDNQGQHHSVFDRGCGFFVSQKSFELSQGLHFRVNAIKRKELTFATSET